MAKATEYELWPWLEVLIKYLSQRVLSDLDRQITMIYSDFASS